MNNRSILIPLCLSIVCVALGSGCRGVQIHQLEQRIDKLETRVAVLESKLESQAHR